MLSFALLIVALLTFGSTALAAPANGDFYVATTGNDRWSGTLPAPNSRRTDGPFATLDRARRALRGVERSHSLHVYVRGGTYSLDRPLTFTPDDSGTPEAPVVYAAYPGETPVLSGGTKITGWEPAGPGRWRAVLPAVKRGEWNFIQLFVNGERRYRPRLPKEGYYLIADGLPPTDADKTAGFDRFRFQPGQIRRDWHNLGDVEVLPFHTWTMSRFRIKDVDDATDTVTFTGHTAGTAGWAAMAKSNRFLVENVQEALDRPGEWYLDRSTGVLTYLPRPGEEMKRAEVIAPRLERLLILQGDVANRRWVHDLVFQGLTFAHSNWVTPLEGHSAPQAESDLSAAIVAEGARGCVIRDGAVEHVGEYAIRWGKGCRRNRVENNEITDMGAGGIMLGEMGYDTDEEAVASHQVVENNRIAHGGRLHNAGIGVWIGQSPYNEILHNDIHDFYYTGVSVGWSWGYGPSHTHHNTIAYNEIYDIGQRVLSDMGGIYTLGVSPGSLLHHNRIHDVNSFSYGGWGIYFDEGTTGMLAEDNLAYRMSAAPFHQHYGKENVVRNNILAFGHEAEVMRTRSEDHLSFTFERNLVYWREGPLLGSNWSGNEYHLDDNDYWNAAGQPVTFAGMTWDDWRKKGQDAHSILADPLFADPEKGDFALRPGSPALALGFQPIATSQIGPLTPARHPDRPVPRAFPLPSP